MSWIGVDLDGTLAHSKAGGWPRIGPPISAMVMRVRTWIDMGLTVKILTARVTRNQATEDRLKQVALVQAWVREHIGHDLEVTAEKDFDMLLLYDDRAVEVIKDTGLLTHDLISIAKIEVGGVLASLGREVDSDKIRASLERILNGLGGTERTDQPTRTMPMEVTR